MLMSRKSLSSARSFGKRSGQSSSALTAGQNATVIRTSNPVRKTAAAAPADDLAPDPAPNEGLPFPVVGVGASAGGFEAVMNLLKHLPVDTGMAFVVVLHLDPRHKSKLTELVARATAMPVHEIKDDMPVEPNRVYILPANLDVIIAQKTLKLVRRPESERLHMPIDHFFQSLAEEQGSRAIGVVLSGTGSDGTVGLLAIKAEAGITFAEDEASAKYFDMPRSAIDAGCVDAVMPPALAEELARIARHPFVRPSRARVKTPEQEFPESIYVTMLRSNPEELRSLFHDLLINVTGFFRDHSVYATLKKKVVPKIIKSKSGQGEIRVWVPGCATGEEVYSLAICLMEEVTRAKRNVKLQIFGTDLSEVAITKARTGIFSSSIAKDVSPERLRRFFSRLSGGSYQISRMIRDMCTFARQNICEDPPFSRLDLISCRNVLIYLGPELQRKCMPIFHYALNPGGYLLLGTSETVGTAADLFTLVDKKHKMYCRKATTPIPNLEFTSKGAASIKPELIWRETPARSESEPGLNIQKQADRILLAQYSPAGVIVDRHLRVHEFRGNTGRYLEHASGSASLNLLQMVRPSLIADLRTTIHKACKNRASARKDGAVFRFNGTPQEVNLQVIPLTVPPSSEIWLLILFDESNPSAGTEPKETRPAARRTGRTGAVRHDPGVVRLRAELDATKESLQAIIEEQEATNEELKSANEEIESSNEELQSTNEELETAKEELQSTNEELTTLNEELSNRNLEMAQINNDLTNLLSSINIPIAMVDNTLAVRRATPMAEKLFNLLPSDIGRRLSDFRANLSIDNLDNLIREVIDTLTTRESKVQDNQGRWYSLRIRPYRTGENKIDGAVITLVDIDEEQRRIARLELASQYNEAILETVREPLLVLDAELRVREASRSFYETFKLNRKKIENIPIYELANGQWDIPELRELLEEVLPKNRRFENFRIERAFPRLGRRTWLVNACRLERKGERLVLLALEDITFAPKARPAPTPATG
ncbi:MAG: histidine kinase [Verrucomicrobia bacterium]|nr:MAG: histidine kinase [Verrucomicrobiota bacterium]